LSDSASILDSLGQARRFADPDSPLKVRTMAAGGALPLPPLQVASVLVALTYDEDEEVRAKAKESLERLPDTVVDPVLVGDVHPHVLDFLARAAVDKPARLEKIALNAVASDETICLLAKQPYPRIIDIISQNQVRLLRCPPIVDALGENSMTSQSTIDRILHFLGVERGETEEPPADSEQDAPAPPPPADADGTNVETPDLTDTSDLPPELVEETEQDEKESEEEFEDRTRSLMAQVQEMSVMEKVKLAVSGNAEARGILIRDRNRIIATSAIRSPKITDNEVINYAKLKSLNEDVYRIISNTRAWTKNYQVKLSLATNAKVSPGTAVKFLNYLTDRDLKLIMRSRDVPSAVSQQARRLLIKKGKI
jgi:hypothetical protein